MSNKTDYIRRIRSLLEKTVENGCTEAEAMLAAEKAADLMAEYELTLTDIELGATTRSANSAKSTPAGPTATRSSSA